MALDWEQLQRKWRQRWAEEKIFQANPDKNRKKFFVNAPYPYVNSILHIGHLYTYMRTEALARYKRMQGFNVLFPQGWHATGTPIISAAKRVKEKEPKQLQLLKDIGIAEKELKKFELPEYWVEYFQPQARADFQALGLSVDWRREFITTSLNPHYDKFVQWQFNKLKAGNYVIKGKFPVVWDPVENCVIGDHDRAEGEGETPQEFLLVKHQLSQNRFVVSATLRQDTILGITNLYVHPQISYTEIEITIGKNQESWILSEPAAERLLQQGHQLKIKKKISGNELIGRQTEEFGGRKVLILPATFLKPEFGTGLVHSVPSDSADDLIALRDLQQEEKTLKQYGLNIKDVLAIKPIPVLKTPDYSDIPAADFLKKYGVKSQHEREKLEQIKKELYKLSHYSAKFNSLYKNAFSRNLEGLPVEQGKELIKQELIQLGWAVPYYELTGKVVSRYLNECIVKIVDDQWFLAYGNENWKKQARAALENLRLYPEKSRTQFEYVIGWLNNWACTREAGLGTKLPWDKKWLIESLSDSTIYMAYYTIAHLIKDIDAREVDDNLFDYVFLNKEIKLKVNLSLARKMRAEFNYWYPVDLRNSGKDLVQNHLTFFLFNHAAIFPKKHWPKGIGVNGWVTIDGEKMSKSKGNIIPLREMPGKFGADCARFTILSGGEELDDPNWDSSLAASLRSKLEQLYEFCIIHYKQGRKNKLKIDQWLEAKLQEIILRATEAMEETKFRSALQAAYFELGQAVRWYARRAKGKFHRETISTVIETQLLLLAPITPFIGEEIWEKIGKTGFISLASWPKANPKLINPQLDWAEEVIKSTLEDIETVIKLAKVDKPAKITLIVSPQWKFELLEALAKIGNKAVEPKEVISEILKNKNLRPYGQEIVKLLPKLLSARMINLPSQDEELNYLLEAKDFLEKEFNCSVEIIAAEQSAHPKAKTALPGKVGVVVE